MELDVFKILERILRDETESRLEDFDRYVLTLESNFASEADGIEKIYKEELKGAQEQDKEIFITTFSDELYIIEEIHVGIYRKSTVISIYSFLESSLSAICKHLYKKHKFPVDLNDISGDGIARSKKYLELLAKVNFSLLNREWCQLSNLNKVRNCIVHCEGKIGNMASGQEKLVNIVENTDGLSIVNIDYIKIEREYIDSCLSNIKIFLNKLYGQVFPEGN